jgi:energy-coupling factor transport system substrate-specific component
MLGAVLFLSKLIFEPLPNIHPLSALVVVYTLVFRKKALVPIYVYVFLQGLIAGFNVWWIPYLYIWLFPWALTMALPKSISKKALFVICPFITALHGILFGTLYAPAQALIMGFDFSTMVKWIVAGLPFDLLHFGSNFVAGLLVVPLYNVIKKVKGT